MEADPGSEYFGKDLEAMSFAKNYHQWIFDDIKPFLGKVIAEVGAGTGNFSELILNHELSHLASFEPSLKMCSILRRKMEHIKNIEIHNNLFEDLSSKHGMKFDSVLYINVLEHIQNDSKTLSQTHQTLNKGGHLIIFVPALSFLYSNFDKKIGHHRRYSKQQLVDLVSSAGYKIKVAKYFDIAGILPWYVFFVLLKKEISGNDVNKYDQWVVPFMRKFERYITPPVGKNILLIASK